MPPRYSYGNSHQSSDNLPPQFLSQVDYQNIHSIAKMMRKNRTALLAFSAVGALVTANYVIKPSRHESIAAGMGAQLDELNSRKEVMQDRIDTILDRTKQMDQAKKAKPWNMTSAERAEKKAQT
ncbi:hypothetical protein PVAG01_02762 [Phlyctema vagabunda]|uniref:Cytochrome b mRNA-processing protein 4 n=1 Tax=Phlyctema vagabunda TaxID=108571 RepID=A0ABR4PRK1_9HELO